MMVRSPYNYDAKEVSMRTGLKCEDVSLAVQSQKDEADINTIVRRFGLTGQLPANIRTPQYGDYTGISDYRSALHAVMDAEKSFMEIPADIRKKFDNDPQKYLEFVTDEKNLEEMVKMGLAVKKATAEKGEVSSTGTAVNKSDVKTTQGELKV